MSTTIRSAQGLLEAESRIARLNVKWPERAHGAGAVYFGSTTSPFSSISTFDVNTATMAALCPARPRSLDSLRHAIRVRHYSIRAAGNHVYCMRRFILFHGKRHPQDLNATKVAAFLTYPPGGGPRCGAVHPERGEVGAAGGPPPDSLKAHEATPRPRQQPEPIGRRPRA
ncbi:MAG: phage integrase N-terminal SAM-like domain-containing protein [Rubrivivax sp.]|nr:phage integrase N-terminal SAM-like domain-containing protein [Rubrivivax sp.]